MDPAKWENRYMAVDKEVWSNFNKAYARLEKERNELLAALKAILNEEQFCDREKITKLIASIEGVKP